MRTVYGGNNVKGRISGALGSGDTSITLASPAEGHTAIADWPDPGLVDVFERTWATLDDGTYKEVVEITARSSSTLTVVRGQQGTTARSWDNNTRIEVRWTWYDALGLANRALPSSLPGSGTVGSIGTTAIVRPAPGWKFDMPVAAVAYHRPVLAAPGGDWRARFTFQNLGIVSGFAAVGVSVLTSSNLYVLGLFGQNYQRWRTTWNAAGTSYVSEDIDQSLFSASHAPLTIELDYDSGSGDLTVTWLVDGYNAPPSLVEVYTLSGTPASVGIGGQGTSGSAGGTLVALLSAELA